LAGIEANYSYSYFLDARNSEGKEFQKQELCSKKIIKKNLKDLFRIFQILVFLKLISNRYKRSKMKESQ